MTLQFQRKPKVKMSGVRLTEEEYNAVEKLAKNHSESIGETIRVLVVDSLKNNGLLTSLKEK